MFKSIDDEIDKLKKGRKEKEKILKANFLEHVKSSGSIGELSPEAIGSLNSKYEAYRDLKSAYALDTKKRIDELNHIKRVSINSHALDPVYRESYKYLRQKSKEPVKTDGQSNSACPRRHCVLF